MKLTVFPFFFCQFLPNFMKRLCHSSVRKSILIYISSRIEEDWIIWMQIKLMQCYIEYIIHTMTIPSHKKINIEREKKQEKIKLIKTKPWMTSFSKSFTKLCENVLCARLKGSQWWSWAASAVFVWFSLRNICCGYFCSFVRVISLVAHWIVTDTRLNAFDMHQWADRIYAYDIKKSVYISFGFIFPLPSENLQNKTSIFRMFADCCEWISKMPEIRDTFYIRYHAKANAKMTRTDISNRQRE